MSGDEAGDYEAYLRQLSLISGDLLASRDHAQITAWLARGAWPLSGAQVHGLQGCLQEVLSMLRARGVSWHVGYCAYMEPRLPATLCAVRAAAWAVPTAGASVLTRQADEVEHALAAARQ